MQSLLKLCIATIAHNFNLVTSLETVPECVCFEIFKVLTQAQRKFTSLEISLFSNSGNFLRELDLKKSRVNNEGLKCVGLVTTLIKLNLEECLNITDNGIDHLTQLTNLLTLSLSKCSGVSDVGVSKICTSLAQIEDLNLSELLTLTEKGLASLSRNQNLKVLSLSHCKLVDDYAVRALTRRSKIFLGGLVSLEHLFLVNCPISDKVVQELMLFPSIKTLDLFGTKVSPKGIEMLADKLNHMEVRMGQCLISKQPSLSETTLDTKKIEDVWSTLDFRPFFECRGYFPHQIYNNKQQSSFTSQQEKIGVKRSYNKIS